MQERADGQSLQVIGAGFGRCGTTSLARALEMLGYGPCYHMQVAMIRYPHLKFWTRAAAGETVDFRSFFSKYRATVDWPACEFYRELMAVYPDAKVLLNTRDPPSWYDSTQQTLWTIDRVLPWWFPKVIRRMHDDLIWNGRFKGQFTDRAKAIEIFDQHLDEVRRTVPPDRVLLALRTAEWLVPALVVAGLAWLGSRLW